MARNRAVDALVPKHDGVVIIITTLLCAYCIILGNPAADPLSLLGGIAAGTTAYIAAKRRATRAGNGGRLAVTLAFSLAAGIASATAAPSLLASQPVIAMILAITASVSTVVAIIASAAFVYRTGKDLRT